MSDDHLSHPALAELWSYWKRKRAGRAMPDRRDIDPTEIPPFVLPNVLMYDLCDGTSKMRFRLVGTEIVKYVGADHTGLDIDAVLSGTYLAYVVDLAREVHRRCLPIYAEAVFRRAGKPSVTTKRLLLPLTNDSADPAIALVGQVFETSGPILEPLDLSGFERNETKRNVLHPQ